MSSPIDGADQPTERIPRVGARHYPAPQPEQPEGVPEPKDESSEQTAVIPQRALPAPPSHPPSPAPPRSVPPGNNAAGGYGSAEPTPTRIMPAVPFDIAPPSDSDPAPFPGRPVDDGAPQELQARAGGRSSRLLIAVSGVLSAGVLLLGVALLVLKFVVPAVRTGSGLDESYGPGTGQIIAHLLVGAVGESTRLLRRRPVSPAVRTGAAAAVIVAVLAVLWWSWWY